MKSPTLCFAGFALFFAVESKMSFFVMLAAGTGSDYHLPICYFYTTVVSLLIVIVTGIFKIGV